MDIALFDFDEHEAIIEPKKTHPPIEGFLQMCRELFYRFNY